MKDIKWHIGVALCGVIIVSGCVRNQFDQQRYEEIVEDESPTPKVDEDHDWMMSTTKTLVVDPSGIENLKLVRIFTDNPAEEVSAEIVDDAYPSGDNKIVMNISYSIRLQVLYAAAIDNEDYYTIVPFNPNSSGSIDFSNPIVKHQKMSNYFVHQTYVYLFEEEYPQPGDYDFNDVVLSVSMERSDGQEVRFKIQLAAVGGTKQMGAAIRLAGYKYNEVESVKTEDDASFDITGVGELPDMYRTMIQDKSLLQQSLNGEAVLNLFADAHWATGDRIISESGSITRKRYNVSYEKSDEYGKFYPRESITETNMRCIPINIQRLRCSGRIRVRILITSRGLSVFLMTTSVGLGMQWLSVIRQGPSASTMAPILISIIHLESGLLIVPNALIGIYTQTKIRFTNKRRSWNDFQLLAFCGPAWA